MASPSDSSPLRSGSRSEIRGDLGEQADGVDHAEGGQHTDGELRAGGGGFELEKLRWIFFQN